ncbi:Dopey, N-terminal domain-containing protein [Cardiosporidium cionae]|uniref:Dopey, N-terminal domain-containing protein n=1 Tax=Cardiosporidium cionae TaxID=476202 RepID=A0ABQ7J4I0_9APIC|nr:Dopey, N-terminal domain-containing protein [Cardiosporidium cionae]|eukprot:KAF8817986.1 Dopey, N-terminal domain-containing protein [Cardiosporidium cionae]
MEGATLSRLIPLLYDASEMAIFSDKIPTELMKCDISLRVASLLHFHCCVTLLNTHFPQEAEEIWKQLFQFLRRLLSEMKNFAGIFWIFSTLIMTDGLYPYVDSSFQSKKIKKDLADLMASLLQIIAMKYEETPKFSSSERWENGFLLPPHLDVILSAMNTSSDKGIPRFIWRHERSIRAFPRLFLLHFTSMDVFTDKYSKNNSPRIFSHFGLILLTMFCSEIISLNRRTLISSQLIQSLCDGLSSHILPSLHIRSLQVLNRCYWMTKLLSLLPYQLFPFCTTTVKKALFDIFSSNSFFLLDRRTLRCWKEILRIVLLNDWQPLSILLPPPHAGMFTSRESDMQARVDHLLRFSFLIFCCPKDTFLEQLSFILERLTESLRVIGAIRVFEKVFLCIRVLFLKISSSSLTPVWPVLLTELIRIFSAKAEKLEESLILAALKVVDLAGVLNIPDFHLYQWMFLSDSITQIAVLTEIPGPLQHVKIRRRSPLEGLSKKWMPSPEKPFSDSKHSLTLSLPFTEGGEDNTNSPPKIHIEGVSQSSLIEEAAAVASLLHRSAKSSSEVLPEVNVKMEDSTHAKNLRGARREGEVALRLTPPSGEFGSGSAGSRMDISEEDVTKHGSTGDPSRFLGGKAAGTSSSYSEGRGTLPFKRKDRKLVGFTPLLHSLDEKYNPINGNSLRKYADEAINSEVSESTPSGIVTALPSTSSTMNIGKSLAEKSMTPSEVYTASLDYSPLQINRTLPIGEQVSEALKQLRDCSGLRCICKDEISEELILRSVENEFLGLSEQMWDAAGADIDVSALSKHFQTHYFAGFDFFVSISLSGEKRF